MEFLLTIYSLIKIRIQPENFLTLTRNGKAKESPWKKKDREKMNRKKNNRKLRKVKNNLKGSEWASN